MKVGKMVTVLPMLRGDEIVRNGKLNKERRESFMSFLRQTGRIDTRSVPSDFEGEIPFQLVGEGLVCVHNAENEWGDYTPHYAIKMQGKAPCGSHV